MKLNTIEILVNTTPPNESKGPFEESPGFSAFLEIYKLYASEIPSEIANDTKLIIITNGLLVLCDTPANNPVVVMTPELAPKYNPCLSDDEFIYRYIYIVPNLFLGNISKV